MSDAQTIISESAMVQADTVARERVASFTVKNLKEYTDRLLHADLKKNEVVFINE